MYGRGDETDSVSYREPFEVGPYWRTLAGKIKAEVYSASTRAVELALSLTQFGHLIVV